MAKSGLSARLSRIRTLEKSLGNQAVPATQGAPKERTATEPQTRASGDLQALPGWTETAPFLYEREALFECEREAFSPFLPLLFPREGVVLSELLESSDSSELYSKLVFFDLETTGLSHGSGTIAFMAALARLEGDGHLRIRQLMVTDYPGEGSFLRRFSDLCGPGPTILVTFNGKAFDSQILLTRFLMNGEKPPRHLGEALHLDLLYPSRRLWKAELGSCRLQVIEEAVLGMGRTYDLPGSEAPDAWFEYLKTGNYDRLLRVGDHNRTDCLTLGKLLFELNRRIDSGQGRAALIRALALRSQKDYEGASAFLEPLASAGDPLARKLFAIDCEHRLGRLQDALDMAELMEDEKRESRLRNKLCPQ